MPQKLVLFFCALAFLAGNAATIARAEPDQSPTVTPTVTLFWVKGCPHCAREIHFLRSLQAEQADLRVRSLEITADHANHALFMDVVSRLDISEPAVPLTLVGNQVWMGYADEVSSGRQLRERIDACRREICPDIVGDLLARKTPGPTIAERVAAPQRMTLPMIGEVRLQSLTLPVLTVMLGALDGFNPCAMWTLVFLIGLLLGMQDRLRMWVLGSAFIAGSALVYFLFMAAWLNLMLFIGAMLIVRVAIGLIAIGAGGYYLRQYFTRADEVCAVTAPEQRQRVFQKLKLLAQEGSFMAALGGILLLAFLVNLVELLCSAGIPAIYTQILAMHDLPAWQYYGYLGLYILVFMADDLLVFMLAMVTLKASGLGGRYAHYSHLVGGVLLLLIGVLMLLRPDILLFG